MLSKENSIRLPAKLLKWNMRLHPDAGPPTHRGTWPWAFTPCRSIRPFATPGRCPCCRSHRNSEVIPGATQRPAPLATYVAEVYGEKMFGDLLRRMTAPEPETLSDDDSRMALAALLVRIARADGSYDDSEKSRINKVLTQRFGLTPFEVAEVRRDAETLESEAPDTVRFTRAIKSAVPHEDREQIMESLWEIALADGSRDHEEDALMRLVAPMLGISDRDSALARQRAAKNG